MGDAGNMIIPLSPSLTFLYSSEPICSVPVFVLDLLAREQGVTPEGDKRLEELLGWSDRIVAGEHGFKSPGIYFDFFRQTIPWQVLAQYLPVPCYLGDGIAEMWSGPDLPRGPFSLRLELIEAPDTLYRYMQVEDPGRIRELLADGKLFMPCPSMFNDPFARLRQSPLVSRGESARDRGTKGPRPGGYWSELVSGAVHGADNGCRRAGLGTSRQSCIPM